MKNIQTRVLKILFCFCTVFFASDSFAQPGLKKADSLFAARQYTQSFDFYKDIFARGWISPAMLLRMAYIHEGLGHVSQSIYYLQIYYQLTNDQLAQAKIQELAEKNKLEGYQSGDEAIFRNVLNRYFIQIMALLAAFVLLFFALMIYQRRQQERPIGAAFGVLIFGALLFVQINFSGSAPQGIVGQSTTYLMSAPSAAADVVAIIDEGHQLPITGQKDIWLRVKWQDKEAYVKADKLLRAGIF